MVLTRLPLVDDGPVGGDGTGGNVVGGVCRAAGVGCVCCTADGCTLLQAELIIASWCNLLGIALLNESNHFISIINVSPLRFQIKGLQMRSFIQLITKKKENLNNALRDVIKVVDTIYTTSAGAVAAARWRRIYSGSCKVSFYFPISPYQ